MTTGIDPSFFHSQPYLDFTGAECLSNLVYIWVELEGWIMFPPLLLSGVGVVGPGKSFPKGDIWCNDIDNNYAGSGAWKEEFLDWEYLFDPVDFLHMDGGDWNTFRKNIRKWPRENPKWTYSMKPPHQARIQEMILDWFEQKGNDIDDAEIIVNFILQRHPGIRRKYIYRDGELVGVNVWDWNAHFINYRLCIAKSGERFLDEFMRYLFYTDPGIQMSRKFVNDGGSLSNDGLERFKDKMNPRYKRKRYSLIKLNKS